MDFENFGNMDFEILVFKDSVDLGVFRTSVRKFSMELLCQQFSSNVLLVTPTTDDKQWRWYLLDGIAAVCGKWVHCGYETSDLFNTDLNRLEKSGVSYVLRFEGSRKHIAHSDEPDPLAKN